MQEEQTTAEHAWLQQLVGDWTFEVVADMGPGQPEMRSTGTERVRSIGGFWVVAEGSGTTPDGKPASMFLTIGYDPKQGKYVGSWFGSMMSKLWVYTGERVGDELHLNTTGPSMTGEGTANYRETVTIRDGQRTFASSVQSPDGSWTTFMRQTFKRA